MNPTKFARDVSGASLSLVHWKWGSRRTMAVGATASRTPNPIDGHMVFIETEAACHIRMGDSHVVADTTDPVLKPGAVYALPRAMGEAFISVVLRDGATAGELEWWEADTFVEA